MNYTNDQIHISLRYRCDDLGYDEALARLINLGLTETDADNLLVPRQAPTTRLVGVR